jgi:hypothetical protein
MKTGVPVGGSGDMVGETEDVEEVNEELLVSLSMFISTNRVLLELSVTLMTSPYSSRSISTAASSKLTIAPGRHEFQYH